MNTTLSEQIERAYDLHEASPDNNCVIKRTEEEVDISPVARDARIAALLDNRLKNSIEFLHWDNPHYFYYQREFSSLMRVVDTLKVELLLELPAKRRDVKVWARSRVHTEATEDDTGSELTLSELGITELCEHIRTGTVVDVLGREEFERFGDSLNQFTIGPIMTELRSDVRGITELIAKAVKKRPPKSFGFTDVSVEDRLKEPFETLPYLSFKDVEASRSEDVSKDVFRCAVDTAERLIEVFKFNVEGNYDDLERGSIFGREERVLEYNLDRLRCVFDSLCLLANLKNTIDYFGLSKLDQFKPLYYAWLECLEILKEYDPNPANYFDRKALKLINGCEDDRICEFLVKELEPKLGLNSGYRQMHYSNTFNGRSYDTSIPFAIETVGAASPTLREKSRSTCKGYFTKSEFREFTDTHNR